MKIAVFLCFVSLALSKSFLSNVFGNNMVLQRAPAAARLWGWSQSPSESVKVTFGSGTISTTSDSEGLWVISLPPTAAGGPYSITIESAAGESAQLSGVLFGDVWICGGQSNMQFTVHQAFNGTEEIANAGKYPNIRMFTVGQGNYSYSPLDELAAIEQQWSIASPSSVGGGNWNYISAVCWWFGKDLNERYNIPIGLISDNWGGTIVQAWSSPDALKKCPQEDFNIETIGKPPNENSLLWNAMIVPYLRMSIKGATWYQGEANAGQPPYYECAFPAMISDWRTKFNIPNFPFLFVQLAAYIEGSPGNELLGAMRVAQTAALQLPSVGFASAVDLGDSNITGNPFGNIHPRNKTEVGRRLSLTARNIVYGDNNVEYLGPQPDTWSSKNSTDTFSITVTFQPSSLYGHSLIYVTNSCPSTVPSTSCSVAHLVSADGGNFNEVSNVVVGHDFAVFQFDQVNFVPVRFEYGYASWPVAVIYNHPMLPLTPFAFNL